MRQQYLKQRLDAYVNQAHESLVLDLIDASRDQQAPEQFRLAVIFARLLDDLLASRVDKFIQPVDGIIDSDQADTVCLCGHLRSAHHHCTEATCYWTPCCRCTCHIFTEAPELPLLSDDDLPF